MSASKIIANGWDNFTGGVTRVVRGTLAGFLGGIAAAWVVNQYQIFKRKPQPRGFLEVEPDADISSEPIANGASVAVAERVSQQIFSHQLTRTERQIAAPIVHYGSSAVAGAMYGGLAEVMPSVGRGLGVPFSTLLWLGADQLVLPALGITKQPVEIPAETHAASISRRFIYGITLDISRRILRRTL